MQASVSSQTASPVDYLLVFVTSFLLWLLLTASLDPQELVAGAVVALIVTALTGDRAAIINGLRLTPTAPLGLVKYLGAFVLLGALGLGGCPRIAKSAISRIFIPYLSIR